MTVRLTLRSPYIPGGEVELRAETIGEAEQAATALRWWGCQVEAAVVDESFEPLELETLR
jgi:hypothetical protein